MSTVLRPTWSMSTSATCAASCATTAAARQSPRSAPSATASMRRLRGLLPQSLRWRLTLWVAAVVLVCTAVIFVVVYNNTGTQLRAQVDRDLRGDTGQLAQ